MSNIEQYLADILAARYGEEVRQSIHDAIEQCYEDGKAGAIDLEARADITTLNNNLANCWKIGRISVTEENVTIASLDTHTFVVAVPEGVSNAVILRARSTDETRTLIPINGYVSGSYFRVIMSNQRASAYTNVTMTIEIIYAYI